jgi:hypothetical protein
MLSRLSTPRQGPWIFSGPVRTSKKVSLIILKSLIFIQGKFPVTAAALQHAHYGLGGLV